MVKMYWYCVIVEKFYYLFIKDGIIENKICYKYFIWIFIFFRCIIFGCLVKLLVLVDVFIIGYILKIKL